MSTAGIDTETPAYLIPRMDDLPISNVRTFRTAVVTQVRAPLEGQRSARSAEWTVSGGYSSQLLAVSAIAVSARGSFIATGSTSGIFRLWNVEQSKQIGAGAISHKAPITRIVFSPDESLAASMDSSGTVLLWETGTGNQHGDPIAADSAFGLQFGPQGRLLIREKNGPLTFFQFVPHGPGFTKSALSFWPQPSKGLALQRVDVGNNGAKASSLNQTGLKRWKETTVRGESYDFDEVNRDDWSVYLNDKSRDISIQIDLPRQKIVAGQGQSAKWDLYDILAVNSNPFTAMKASFAPAGPVFAAGDGNGTLYFWTTPVHGFSLRGVEVGPKDTKTGAFIQTGPKKWRELDVKGATVADFNEIKRDESSVFLEDPSRGIALQIDLANRMISGTQQSPSLKFHYKVLSATPAADAIFATRWSADPLPIGSVKALAISPDDTLVAAGGDAGPIVMWRRSSGGLVGKPFTIDSAVNELTFSPDGSVLASLHQNGTLALWDSATGERLPDYQQVPPLQAAAFSADWSLLAVASGNGSITLLRDNQDIVARPLSIPQPGGVLQKARPAEGVLMIHEQSWVMQGLAVGELLHSVCLAPGEITQIAVTSHTTRTIQQSVDTAGQEEALSQTATATSSISEAERASASESSAGGSTAFSAGASAQTGANLLFASAGSSVNSSTAVTASFSTGTRNVADETNQSVHEGAAEAARLSRRLYSAAVREVSESDNVELRTRVVANYNHMHALNVQYYEVVQVQRLRTRVTDAFRLLFLPMQMIDFADPTQNRVAATRFRRELVDVTRALGLTSIAVCLDLLALGEAFTTDLIDYRLGETWNRVSELDNAITDQDKVVKEGKDLCISSEDSVLGARDALRRFNANHEDTSLLERAKLQRALQAALEQSRLAEARQAVSVATAQRLRADRDNAAALKIQLQKVIDPFLKDPSKPMLDQQGFAAIEKLVFKALADNQLAVNQGLWMRIDPSTYAGLLQGQAVGGQPLATSVDPNPVAVAGNYVGFRWHHSDPKDELAFRLRFVGTEAMEDSIALPTSGVFGEAVLGESNSAEKIDLTRFWNWSEALPPIRPTLIAPLKQPTGQASTAPTLPNLAAPGTQLGPIVFPQVASGAATLADALKNPDLFRDMSGSAASAALARSAVELAAQGSSEAASLAQKNYLRQLALQEKIAGTVLGKGGSNGEGAGGKRNLDPTLAGGLANANPDLPKSGDESAGDESSEGLEDVGKIGGDSAPIGGPSKSDAEAVEIEFIEEQP